MLQMLKDVKLLMIRQKNVDFYLFFFEFLRFLIFMRCWGLALVAHVQCRFSDVLCSVS